MSEEKNDAYTVYASTDYVDEKIANVGGVTSWNDLGNKKTLTTFQMTDIPFTYNNTYKYAMSNTVYESAGVFVIGETYSVTFDGVKYDGLVAFKSNGMIVIGASNPNAMTEELPFMVVTYLYNDSYSIGFYTFFKDQTHTVSVEGVFENVVQLPFDYLPTELMDYTPYVAYAEYYYNTDSYKLISDFNELSNIAEYSKRPVILKILLISSDGISGSKTAYYERTTSNAFWFRAASGYANKGGKIVFDHFDYYAVSNSGIELHTDVTRELKLTSDTGKLFKITVDDSGTITAKEITE